MKHPLSIPVAIFVRVSKKNQKHDRQISELTEYATRKGYTVVSVIKEFGSAYKRKVVDRPELEELLALCRSRQIKKILVSEFSRLGRRRGETTLLMEQVMELGVSIYAHNLGMETLKENGKRDSITSFVQAIYAERDAWESEMTSERIQSGVEEARRKGTTLGRKKGSVKTDAQILQQYAPVARDIRKGLSVRQAAKIHEVSTKTVLRVKKAMQQQNSSSEALYV